MTHTGSQGAPKTAFEIADRITVAPVASVEPDRKTGAIRVRRVLVAQKAGLRASLPHEQAPT